MLGLAIILTMAAGAAAFGLMGDDDDGEASNGTTREFDDNSQLLAGEDYRSLLEDSPAISDELVEDVTFLAGPLDIDTGGSRDDVIGSAGDDTIAGGEGSDVVLGGEGDDLLILGDGNDYSGAMDLDGSYPADKFEVQEVEILQAGDDTIGAGPGNDTIEDLVGENTLYGRQGADLISAWDWEGDADTYSPDTVFGGWGADAIIVDQGDEVSTGGGQDVVTVLLDTYSDGFEPVEIKDFNPSEDQITLSGAESLLVQQPGDFIDPVTVADASDGSGSYVLVDGVPVVIVEGVMGLTRSDITIST